MTRRTHEIRTTFAAAAGGIVALGLFASAGCTQQERSNVAHSAAQFAAASVTTATGQATTTTTTPHRSSGIKLNGNGGFDASEAQQAALQRAYYMRDHHNDVIKPFHATSQPTSQPTAQSMGQPTGQSSGATMGQPLGQPFTGR